MLKGRSGHTRVWVLRLCLCARLEPSRACAFLPFYLVLKFRALALLHSLFLALLRSLSLALGLSRFLFFRLVLLNLRVYIFGITERT
jgi:hypothetical protein